MPFSHHSHSGQFCGHATHTLEEMVQEAIRRKMTVFALTEHMPRDRDDELYSGEVEISMTPAKLAVLFDAYYHEAVRLRKLYAPQIKILIGLEIDWIRPASKQTVEGLLQKYPFDLFVGSVHHVHTIPVDYTAPLYVEAREQAGGTDEKLFEDYFDAQYEMLQALKPPIVGHFDLIRLKSEDPERSFKQWPGVWRAIERNLEFTAGYGGLLELNSASLRKGMSEPYPMAEICQAFLKQGGRFTLSDDSHGVEQVGVHYEKVLEFVERTGIQDLHFFVREDATSDLRFPHTSLRSASVASIKDHAFWSVKSSRDVVADG